MTKLAPSTVSFPFETPVPIVETKESWGGNWKVDETIEPINASRSTANDGQVETAVFLRRYGEVINPVRSNKRKRASDTPRFHSQDRLNLLNHWIQIRLTPPSGRGKGEIIWRGRVYAQQDDIGSGDKNQSVGNQQFIAYSPSHSFNLIEINKSFHNDNSAGNITLDTTPDFNYRDNGGLLKGNRSDIFTSKGSFGFGGTSIWNNKECVEYLLTGFINITDGPQFELAGITEELERIKTFTPGLQGATVSQILTRLISRDFGLDYTLIPSDSGWDIFIFSLSDGSISFGDYSHPRNENEITVNTDGTSDVQIKVEDYTGRLYDKVIIRGERRVMVFSLSYDDGNLVEGWSNSLEDIYKDGTGDSNDEPEKHDIVRTSDRFRSVFQTHLAKSDWDYNLGNANPLFSNDGSVIGSDTDNLQNNYRRTLPWTPFREGFDYTQDPPEDNNIDAIESSFIPPLVVIKDYVWSWYVSLDKLGSFSDSIGAPLSDIAIETLEKDLGVQLHSSPNHQLARENWSGANESGFDPTFFGLDYNDIHVTLAMELDKFLEVSSNIESVNESLKKDDGSEIVIDIPGASWWGVAANTIVKINESDGTLLKSPSSLMVIRDDTDLLRRLMVGVIARYQRKRKRVVLTARKLADWSKLVGFLLVTVNKDLNIDAPITGISWNFQSGTTRLTTGFAL